MKKDKKGLNEPTEQLLHPVHPELEKSKVQIMVEIIEYIPNAVVSKTIVKKITGNITVSSFDAGEEVAEKTSPFDNFLQIIDGAAEVVINDKTYKGEHKKTWGG